MPSKFVNFTRGSQLIGHFGFMFAAGLKAPGLLAAASFGGLIWWRLAHGLSDQQSYLCWLRLYVLGYCWFEFDASRLVDLAAGGRQMLVPISSAASHPLVTAAWGKALTEARAGAVLAMLITAPATVAFSWIAAWFGRRSKESRHERGATLASTAALRREIKAHNAIERAREYRRLLGRGWRLLSARERREAELYQPYSIAGIPYPWRLEQSHTMLIGTTGTGKTVALKALLAEARARGDRAVVFDLTGAFIEAFYDPDRDTILNPLDARCPQWSVFEDCEDEAGFTAAAEALVPHDGGGAEQFWVLAARMLFVEMCLRLAAQGRTTNQALSDELMTASLAHVHTLMQGTLADPLTAPEAARMAESIRAVFNANAKAIRMLPTNGPRFSVRRWIGGGGPAGGFLFVAARYVDMPVASRLLTVWMDMAMTTLMSGRRSADLRTWFVFDELGALHRLPALEKGLQTARNYGGAIVAGVHAYAKLKETYGDNMAMTLAALARTKLVLATADRESALWCSDFIGHRQVREMEEGYSYGYNNSRDAVSLTPRRLVEPLLLPDQLMNLPRLRGYLKFPDGFPAAAIQLTYVDHPSVAPPFVARMRMGPPGNEPRLRGGAPDGDRAGTTDQGPGPSVNAATGDAPAAGVTPTLSPDDPPFPHHHSPLDTPPAGLPLNMFARISRTRPEDAADAPPLQQQHGAGAGGKPAGSARDRASSRSERNGPATPPAPDHLAMRELRQSVATELVDPDAGFDLGG